MTQPSNTSEMITTPPISLYTHPSTRCIIATQPRNKSSDASTTHPLALEKTNSCAIKADTHAQARNATFAQNKDHHAKHASNRHTAADNAAQT
jgi:hypothetical protein